VQDFENPYHTYSGMHNGKNYELSFIAGEYSDGKSDEQSNSGEFEFDFYRSGSENERMAAEEGAKSLFSFPENQTAVDISEMTNEAEINGDMAVSVALTLADAFGAGDMVVDRIENLVLVYMYDDYSVPKVNGYVVRLKRELNGCPIFDWKEPELGLWNDMYSVIGVREYIDVYVDDTGIISANGMLYTDMQSVTEEKTELLSWDDMLKKADTELNDYYKKYRSDHKTVTFNDISLQYVLTVDKDGNKKYVPAWVFVEYEDYDDPEAYRDGEYPIRQLAYINLVS
jgi:hypothetical protein